MTQNNINNRSSQLTIDPLSASDSFIQFDVSGTGKFRHGVDNSDDSFRVSIGSALGTNDSLIIASSGTRTLPLTPIAKFTNSTTRSNVTGDNTGYAIEWDTVRYDTTSSLSSNTTFTAPVDGIYLMSAAITLTGLSALNNETNFWSEGTSIANNIRTIINGFGLIPSGSNLSVFLTGIISMSASDQRIIKVQIGGSTKTISIAGDASQNFFSISMIC